MTDLFQITTQATGTTLHHSLNIRNVPCTRLTTRLPPILIVLRQHYNYAGVTKLPIVPKAMPAYCAHL